VAKSVPFPPYREIAAEVDATLTPTLDVGCGNSKIPGAIGIDIAGGTQADIVHDLNKLPWPLEDNSFDIVRLWSVLEHLDDVVAILQEVQRVARPGGLVIVGVPHFSSANAYTDPTHRHYFSGRFADYMVEGTESFRHFGFYGSARFRMLERRVTLSPFWARLRLTRLLNRNLMLYETYLCFLIRGADIQLKLQVVK